MAPKRKIGHSNRSNKRKTGEKSELSMVENPTIKETDAIVEGNSSEAQVDWEDIKHQYKDWKEQFDSWKNLCSSWKNDFESWKKDRDSDKNEIIDQCEEQRHILQATVVEGQKEADAVSKTLLDEVAVNQDKKMAKDDTAAVQTLGSISKNGVYSGPDNETGLATSATSEGYYITKFPDVKTVPDDSEMKKLQLFFKESLTLSSWRTFILNTPEIRRSYIESKIACEKEGISNYFDLPLNVMAPEKPECSKAQNRTKAACELKENKTFFDSPQTLMVPKTPKRSNVACDLEEYEASFNSPPIIFQPEGPKHSNVGCEQEKYDKLLDLTPTLLVPKGLINRSIPKSFNAPNLQRPLDRPKEGYNSCKVSSQTDDSDCKIIFEFPPIPKTIESPKVNQASKFCEATYVMEQNRNIFDSPPSLQEIIQMRPERFRSQWRWPFIVQRNPELENRKRKTSEMSTGSKKESEELMKKAQIYYSLMKKAPKPKREPSHSFFPRQHPTESKSNDIEEVMADFKVDYNSSFTPMEIEEKIASKKKNQKQ